MEAPASLVLDQGIFNFTTCASSCSDGTDKDNPTVEGACFTKYFSTANTGTMKTPISTYVVVRLSEAGHGKHIPWQHFEAGSGSGSGSASSAASGSPSLQVVSGLGQLAAWGSCAGREEAHSSAARCAWVEGAGGSDGNRQAAYDAQRLQRECEILVQVGLVVRCDQCTNSGVLVFNELCEPCRVEVAMEGQARAYINGAL